MDLHEMDVDAAREDGGIFEQRADLLQRNLGDLLAEEHRVRIAHGDASDARIKAADIHQRRPTTGSA